MIDRFLFQAFLQCFSFLFRSAIVSENPKGLKLLWQAFGKSEGLKTFVASFPKKKKGLKLLWQAFPKKRRG